MKSLSLLPILLCGCTVIGSQPSPSDWPTLAVKINRVSVMETQRQCSTPMLMALGSIVLGCAKPEFCPRTCTITLFTDAVLDHELQHCAGKDHVGSTAFADHWSDWKNMRGAEMCRAHLGDEKYFAIWPEKR